MSSSGQKSSFAQTCNLLSQCFKENGSFATKFEDNKGVKTLNLLPNLENSAEISSQNEKNDAILEHGSSSSQMTIFYAGKVFVFSDFPAEKAKEIMALATKSSPDVNITPDLNIASTSVKNNNSKNIATPVQFKKDSLQRFFEKRKDRAAARAPYQVKSPSSMAAAPSKPDDQSKCPGLELEGQSSELIDLNF